MSTTASAPKTPDHPIVSMNAEKRLSICLALLSALAAGAVIIPSPNDVAAKIDDIHGRYRELIPVAKPTQGKPAVLADSLATARTAWHEFYAAKFEAGRGFTLAELNAEIDRVNGCGAKDIPARMIARLATCAAAGIIDGPRPCNGGGCGPHTQRVPDASDRPGGIRLPPLAPESTSMGAPPPDMGG